MLRRSTLAVWEAVSLGTKRHSILERAAVAAGDCLPAVVGDAGDSIGAGSGAAASTSYDAHEGDAGMGTSAHVFDMGGRRWKQTWQKQMRKQAGMAGAPHNSPAQQRRNRAGSTDSVRSGTPHSLALPPSSPLFKCETAPGGWRQLALRVMGYYTPESRVARGSTALFERITQQAENGSLHEALHLRVSFRSVFSLLVLHVWLCLVRLRKDGPERGAPVGQLLYDLFQHDIEKRVVKQGVTVSTSSYLRDLEKMFYGAASAYDNAIAEGAHPRDLPQALWRNVLAEEGEPRELPEGERTRDAEALARYVRRELASLEVTDSESFLGGNISFHADIDA